MNNIKCPMCEPGTCPGGAHVFALAEDGITTREQYLSLADREQEQHNESKSKMQIHAGESLPML